MYVSSSSVMITLVNEYVKGVCVFCQKTGCTWSTGGNSSPAVLEWLLLLLQGCDSPDYSTLVISVQ